MGEGWERGGEEGEMDSEDEEGEIGLSLVLKLGGGCVIPLEKIFRLRFQIWLWGSWSCG